MDRPCISHAALSASTPNGIRTRVSTFRARPRPSRRCHRVAFVAAKARDPEAGKLFLDYLLSKAGQEVIAKAELYSIRADVTGEATAKAVNDKLGDKAKPIPVSTELLGSLEQDKRLAFMKQWQASQAK